MEEPRLDTSLPGLSPCLCSHPLSESGRSRAFRPQPLYREMERNGMTTPCLLRGGQESLWVTEGDVVGESEESNALTSCGGQSGRTELGRDGGPLPTSCLPVSCRP